MTNYEDIYLHAMHASYSSPGCFGEKARQAARAAGIAAVVAAAKAEALEEAAAEASEVLFVNERGLQNADASSDCFGPVTVSGWLRSYSAANDCPVSHCSRSHGHSGAHNDKIGGFA